MIDKGALFQRNIDRWLGVVGRNIGTPYAAYRIARDSAGNFPDGWLKLSQQARFVRTRVTQRNAETGLMSERAVWYEIAGDVSPFLLGDVFVSLDRPYHPARAYGAGASILKGTGELDAVALASHARTQPPLGVRIDRRVGVFRPLLNPAPGGDGVVRWRTTHEADTPLVLSGGTYSWGTAGEEASWVPCGLGSNDRQMSSGGFPPDKIGITPVPRYMAYLPPLPGYDPNGGDALITEDGARYTVVSPFRQEAGAIGSLLLIERFIGQDT